MTLTQLFEKEDDSPVTPILRKYRASIMNFEQLQDVPNPEYLIEGILLKEYVAVLWGESAAGKSFLATDLAMSMATGKEWFGHRVNQTKVLYVIGEGRSGIKQRVNAWVAKHQKMPEEEDMVWMSQMVDIIDPTAFQATIQVIDEERPGLVVIDTLARAFTGHNENDTTDMGLFVAGAEEIRDRFSCSVLLIHHPNAGAVKKMRGNGALRGAIDAEYELEHTNTEDPFSARVLYCRKMKDAAPFAPFPIYLVSVRDSLVPMPTPYDVKTL